MIEFDYFCNACFSHTTNKEMESFVCKCGGEFKHDSLGIYRESTFQPHYSPEIKDYVNSWKDAEEKGKKFKSASHPNGFVITQGNTKFMKELKYIHKHKEDYIQQVYKEKGIRYRPGSNVRMDAKTNSFVPASSR